MNQACERGGTAVPYSAVPVLPATGPPGTSASAVAVPSVTTARIMSRSAGSTAAGGPGRRCPGRRATADQRRHDRAALGHLRRDQRHRQRADLDPALADRLGGLLGVVLRHRHRPAERARGQLPLGAHSVPGGGGRQRLRVQPLGQAGEGGVARVRERLPQRDPAEVELVLVLELLPYTTVVPGQATAEVGCTTFACSSAVEVRILNVEPAGKRPDRPSSNGTCALSATARIAPVDGRIATSAAACGTVATAVSAAVCTERSSVVRTALPACPGSSASTPAEVEIRAPGRPASCPFSARCRPETPSCVGAVVAGADLLEHVRGGRPDPAEQRLGEGPGRREQLLRLLEDRAGQAVDLRADLLVVRPAQRDHRHERVRLGLRHVGDDLGRVDREHAGEPGREPGQVGDLARLHARRSPRRYWRTAACRRRPAARPAPAARAPA